jgi:hypothetical protein
MLTGIVQIEPAIPLARLLRSAERRSRSNHR